MLSINDIVYCPDIETRSMIFKELLTLKYSIYEETLTFKTIKEYPNLIFSDNEKICGNSAVHNKRQYNWLTIPEFLAKARLDNPNALVIPITDIELNQLIYLLKKVL